jgi:hypothetical protein
MDYTIAKVKHLLDRLAWWIAFRLPRKVVLYAYVRLIAWATSRYPDKTPDEITYVMGCVAWEVAPEEQPA